MSSSPVKRQLGVAVPPVLGGETRAEPLITPFRLCDLFLRRLLFGTLTVL